MNKNFGIAFFVLVLSLPGVRAALAVQAVEIPPVIVQPYDLQGLNQQILDRDRQNRDEEFAIKELIEENNKLTQETLARQEDEGLRKIDQTMLSYRNALFSRDRERIMANSERASSRYGDLIALTEDADAMTEYHRALENKSDLLAEKYQMLTALKDEMTALNEKLKGEGKFAQEQQGKIQMLVGRLDEADQKISRFDGMIAQKDRRIAQLKNKIQQQGLDLKADNESIRWLKEVLAAAKIKAEYYQLTSQLDQIALQQVQKAGIQSGQKTQAQAGSLKQQLADEQNKVDLLKQELERKITQSNEMTLILEDYQKKLESKDNAANEQLRQLLSFKNYQARMEAQIADLNARLQEKEARVVKIKKDVYDLQESVSARERDIQSKDLNLSMIQQKMMEGKVNEYQDKISGLQAARGKQTDEIRQLRTELALVRQQLKGAPTSDEIDFLRTGLNKAVAQLKEKDAMLGAIKADADKYEKEFKEQFQELQSTREQLQSAYEEINHKNEDLKNKDLAIIRLKERAAIQGKPNEDNAQALPKGDRLREKLKQALDEIDEQGRVINVLIQKLQNCRQNVNLTQYFSK